MRVLTFARIISFCVCLVAAHEARTAERPPTTVIILDCSRSMGEAFLDRGTAVATDDTHPTTRLSISKDVILAALNDLSVDAKGRPVALWLYGHRLAWEPGKTDPDLLEQTKYLEQTLGFQVLTHLLPGDDVEIVRPAIKLEPRHLNEIEMRLSVVKPWGEDPLYLTMLRAIDNLGSSAVTGAHRIIVVTDSGNHQGMCKFATNKEQIFEALERSAPVTLNMIVLGGTDSINRQTEAEFNQLAGKSHGQVAFARSGAELAAKMRDALQDAPPKPTIQPVAMPDQLQQAIALLKTGSTANARALQGRVVFMDKTIDKAKVVLEGDIGLKTFRTVTAPNGSFEFPAVPPGRYVLRAEFIIRNRIRDAAVPIVVEGNGGEALSLDVQLQ